MKSIALSVAIIALFQFSGCAQKNTFRSVNEAKGLPVGQKAPDFSALDINGKKYELSSLLKSGPVVLIFYRGFWCPVCNKHLKTLEDSLQFVIQKGAELIAVSPEKMEYGEITAQKTGATFPLLYDEDYKIENAYDVTFLPEASQLFLYNIALNGKLKESHSDESERLPIPATYIIDQNGIIVWRQFNPDYKKRASVKDILLNIPQKKM